MIKYIGSKRLLLDHIRAAVGAMADVRRVTDAFSGTARVGRALREAGYDVLGNDHLAFAATLARCYVAADVERVSRPATAILAELNGLPGRAGYFTHEYCEEARYLHPKNGARVDAIRDAIAAKSLDPELEAVVLTALLEAADRVDSTTGVQMAYLKKWARRAQNDLELRLPALVPGTGRASQREAAEAVTEPADLVYLDPPYNQHSYLGNYHLWETLVRWDAPETYGVARKRTSCRTYRNAFNSKVRIGEAFRAVVEATAAPRMLVSFNDEGFLGRAEVEAILAARGYVSTVAIGYPRYVGAKIGIHDPKGRKVGKVGRTRNRELLFVVGPDRAEVEAAARAAEAVGDVGRDQSGGRRSAR